METSARKTCARFAAAAVALCAAWGVAWGCRGHTALADTPSPARGVASADYVVDLGPRALPPPVLAVEVLSALEAGSPRVLEETLRPWANAIADQADDRRDAIRMAFVVTDESAHFAPEVLDYRCNRGGYLSCDHGNAVGPFQVWDRSLIGAATEEHVRKAHARMRVDPHAWTTWQHAVAQADEWLAGHEFTPADDPAVHHVRIAQAPAAAVAAAREYLAEGLPIGSEKAIDVDGQRYALVVEWHYHPAGFKGGPVGYHHGVTVFAVR